MFLITGITILETPKLLFVFANMNIKTKRKFI